MYEPKLELIDMLKMLKRQASTVATKNDKKAVLLEDVQLDSFDFVIDQAIEYIEEN